MCINGSIEAHNTIKMTQITQNFIVSMKEKKKKVDEKSKTY